MAARPGSLPLSKLLDALGASEEGLSSEEARRRLGVAGLNEPAERRRRGPVRALRSFIANPLMLVLLIAGLASAFLGREVDAAIIVTMVVLGVAITSVQTYRSDRAVERLRSQLAPTATALRDGRWSEVPRRELVPGDVVRLAAGDLVPADGRLLQARDLHLNEAALTGESLPVEKEADLADAPCSERSRVLFGTSVVSGTGTALVVETGRSTQFGAIAQALATRPPETEFDRGARRFGLLIMKTVLVLVLFIALAAFALGRPPFESMLFAVALAVGLTPEFLPLITSVTLAQGAVHMAREQVIVKNLAAIQNLGSLDILCSDKTGTLTSGQMELERHVDPFGEETERVFHLAYLNCLHQTGVEHPLDRAVLDEGPRTPLDSAILGHGHPDLRSYRKVDEIPFDFERRRLSVVVEWDEGRMLVSKGAPEQLFPLCSALEHQGRVEPMTEEMRARAKDTFERLSASGFRVLAIAYKNVPWQPAYRREDERELVLAGLLAFVDPPLGHTREALEALRRDGVEVKVLTGDNERVAAYVCAQVGVDPRRVMTGDALDRISDSALAHLAARTTVFARVSPSQKNRILLALKARGHVVGFLGDGINDAPSLHAADVGISVSGAVDVARDAAEVILLKRDLAVLHRGIVEGRKAFGNVVKYLLMGTSSNFGNMFSMAGAFLFLPFLPMLPTQILLNNLLYDLAQVTIPTDRVDPAFIQKPRRWDISHIRNFMLTIGPISSVYDFLTFFALLWLFHAGEPEFHTGWFVESLATQTLVIFVIRSERPLHSRASLPLAFTTIGVVVIGILLPFTPLAKPFGFVPLPGTFFLFLAAATLTYLALVAVARSLLARERSRAHPLPLDSTGEERLRARRDSNPRPSDSKSDALSS